MNTQSPLVPQGTTPPKGRSNVQIAVFAIVAVHVVFIAGMMMQGCKDSTQPPPATVATMDTNPPVAPAPAPIVAPTPVVSNPPPAVVSPQPLTSPHQAPDALPVAPPPASTGGKEYAIAKGDTLGNVALKNHVSLKALEDANPGVNPLKLQIGQKIKIPDGAAATAATDTAAPDAASGDTMTYTVKSGDALEKIAKKNGTTVKAIVELNHLKSMNSIKAGQKLKLPAPKTAAAATPADATPPAPVAPPAVTAPAPATGTATN